MKNDEVVKDWLRRAKSNLEIAKAKKISQYVLYEDLCFEAQQSAEKAIKALLIHFNKEFPWTHSIGDILDVVSESGIIVPENIRKAEKLTRYAVHTRYPGTGTPVSEDKYKEAVKLAETVFKWVNKVVNGKKR